MTSHRTQLVASRVDAKGDLSSQEIDYDISYSSELQYNLSSLIQTNGLIRMHFTLYSI